MTIQAIPTPPSAKEAQSGLAPWTPAELPAPPLARGFSLLGVIGPGVILLGLSLGSGEWLLGPAAFVQYGPTLLWVTTLAVGLQTVLNTELVRYTLYTGEPALTGFMRTRPYASWWAWFYGSLWFLQVGWPAWAGTAAGAIFYLFAGRLANQADADSVYFIGAASFLACVAVLLVSRHIERTLEVLNWILLVFILGGLALLCVLFTNPGSWIGMILGFAGFDLKAGAFNFLPSGADWFLIGAFAAYSGAGGVVNLMLCNWVRDKGYGMGQVVGYIPAAIGGQSKTLAHTGSIFEMNSENLARWRAWWRIIQVDQYGVFFVGTLLGMGLPALLYTTFIEPGTDIRGLAVAAELANAMARRGGVALTFIVAFLGAWILFKTQLVSLEGTVRAITDLLWSASARVRRWRGGDVRLVYYTVLAFNLAWGLVTLRLTEPIILLELGANIAGLVFAISALHILYVNTTFLPQELRPPLWRRAALVLLAIFYCSFVYLWLRGGFIPDLARAFPY
ncbi:MAG: Nramp family divalent metal transporter [Chloroflexota bacterium]